MAARPLRLFGIPNCDTVKRARAWLAAEGVMVEFHDFRKQGVPSADLPRWADAVGWERLLNRQGTTWRKLDPAAQARAADRAGALALMAEQPSVIKRPVIDWPDGGISVGFDPQAFAERLGGAR